MLLVLFSFQLNLQRIKKKLIFSIYLFPWSKGVLNMKLAWFWQESNEPEGATAMNLCNAVFTDPVIFSIIFEHFFPRNLRHRTLCVRIHSTITTKRRSKCYQNTRNTIF